MTYNIHVTFCRPCNAIVYKRADAQHIDLIQGFYFKKPVFVVMRGLDESFEDFYERGVDQLWEVKMLVHDTLFNTDHDPEAYLLLDLILVDMALEMRTYNDLFHSDRCVEDPDDDTDPRFSDYMYSVMTRNLSASE